MFDIGIGEILIVAVVGLLIFGPERLPRAAADAAKWVKQVRAMATGARKDLADSAGIDLSDSLDAVRSLQEFHPRKLASSLLSDDDDDTPARPASGSTAARPAVPDFDPDAT